MTISEIDAEITRLRNLRYEAEREEIEEFKKTAQQHVGRCFKVNGIYCIVIGVPREESTLHGFSFNKYQFPALYVQYDGGIKELPAGTQPIMPLHMGHLFSAAWGEGNNMTGTKYEEISPDEFYSHLCEALHGIRISVKERIETRKELLNHG